MHPHDATPVMQSIVNDLKSINNRLQIYLKQTRQKKQQELEIIREKYEIIGVQISQILTQIIYQISQPLTSKESLTQKEQKIVQTLNKLQQENAKIRKFSHISFNSKEDIQSYFKKIITNIRREIQTLKELL